MLRQKQREGAEVDVTKMGRKIETSRKERGEVKQKESWTRCE